MTICPSCGQQSPVAARFCLACGTRLAEEEATRREVRKIVTVVFSDVASSTELGERLDPESLRRAMGRYFDEMREARVAGDKPLRVSLVPARNGLSPLLSLLATLANWHTRVRPQPSPPRTSRYRFRSPRNPDRIDGSPLLTKPQHNGEVNEQADLRPPCRAFIAAAFDALREEPVTGPRPPRPRQLISVAEHADSEQGARSVVIVESVSRRGYRPAASPAAFAVIANPVSWRQHAGRVHALSYRRRARAS